MAPLVVIDSGFVLATGLGETHGEKAENLFEYWKKQQIQIVAPMLFRYEIVAVLRKVVFQKRITLDDALDIHDAILGQNIQFYIDTTLLKRAYDLATQFNRPTAYDAQYLAVAERFQCEFWTADERLFNAVNNTLPWVKWLGNFTASI